MPLQVKTNLSAQCDDCDKPFPGSAEHQGQFEEMVEAEGWEWHGETHLRCRECLTKHRLKLQQSENIYERIEGGAYRVPDSVTDTDQWRLVQKELDEKFKADALLYSKIVDHVDLLTDASKAGWLDKVYDWAKARGGNKVDIVNELQAAHQLLSF